MDFNLWFFATKIIFLRSYWSKFVVDSLSCTQLHVVSQSAPTHVNGWSGYSAIAPKMFIVTCKFVTQSKYINKTETETNGMLYGWIFLTFAIKNMWFCMHHWSVVKKLFWQLGCACAGNVGIVRVDKKIVDSVERLPLLEVQLYCRQSLYCWFGKKLLFDQECKRLMYWPCCCCWCPWARPFTFLSLTSSKIVAFRWGKDYLHQSEYILNNEGFIKIYCLQALG